MNLSFNADMLQIARESQGFTQTQLAKQIKKSQSHIANIEQNKVQPDEDVVNSMAEVLDFPAGFFYQKGDMVGIGMSTFFYRKRASTRVKSLRLLQAEINIRVSHLRQLLNEVDIESPFDIPQLEIEEFNSPEHVANIIRANWQQPMGPIKNLINLIEQAGGIVFQFDFPTPDIDAVSVKPPDLPPLFFINESKPPCRIRFSLAHELGHMVLHRYVTDSMEEEADRFASELLLPEKEIKPNLRNVNLSSAANLKPYWRVSMAALIRRAKDLKAITPDAYSRQMKYLSMTGQRKHELVEIESESPQLLNSIIDAYSEVTACSHYEIAEQCNERYESFQQRMMNRPAIRYTG